MNGVEREGMHDRSGKGGHAWPEWKGSACMTGVGREGMHDGNRKFENV
jgi:hypothetical protein